MWKDPKSALQKSKYLAIWGLAMVVSGFELAPRYGDQGPSQRWVMFGLVAMGIAFVVGWIAVRRIIASERQTNLKRLVSKK